MNICNRMFPRDMVCLRIIPCIKEIPMIMMMIMMMMIMMMIMMMMMMMIIIIIRSLKKYN